MPKCKECLQDLPKLPLPEKYLEAVAQFRTNDVGRDPIHQLRVMLMVLHNANLINEDTYTNGCKDLHYGVYEDPSE